MPMPATRGHSQDCLAPLQTQQGIMLLALLIFLAIAGLVATKTVEVWSTALTRERELELLFAGEQYRAAIERYYYATPGNQKALPVSLDDLVKDDRFPKPQHHLRQHYLDPMRDSNSWGILRQGSGIVGVYSLSEQKPIKAAGFSTRYADFSAAQSYRGWRFMFRLPTTKATDSTLRAPTVTTPLITAQDKQTFPAASNTP